MCIDTSLIQFRQQIFADTLLPYHYTTPHNHPRDWICTLNILERLLPRFLEEEKKNYINGISFQFSQSTQKFRHNVIHKSFLQIQFLRNNNNTNFVSFFFAVGRRRIWFRTEFCHLGIEKHHPNVGTIGHMFSQFASWSLVSIYRHFEEKYSKFTSMCWGWIDGAFIKKVKIVKFL